MEDDNFRILVEILKKLQKTDYAGSTIESAIVEILDSIEKSLTEEQKQILIKEFIHYHRLRNTKENEAKKRREEALYREQISSYLFDSH